MNLDTRGSRRRPQWLTQGQQCQEPCCAPQSQPSSSPFVSIGQSATPLEILTIEALLCQTAEEVAPPLAASAPRQTPAAEGTRRGASSLVAKYQPQQTRPCIAEGGVARALPMSRCRGEVVFTFSAMLENARRVLRIGTRAVSVRRMMLPMLRHLLDSVGTSGGALIVGSSALATLVLLARGKARKRLA